MVNRLAVDGLTVRYGGVVAIEDVSLTFSARQIAGLVGPNGAGKSTMLAAASGMLRPSAGRILFGGDQLPIGKPHEFARSGIRRTFQTSRPLAGLTIGENVMLGRLGSGRITMFDDLLHTRRARRGSAVNRRSALDALDAVGLADLIDEPVTVLSYGQVRLMEFARALVADPWLVLLDEPAAGLNLAEAQEFGRLLLRVVKERAIGVVLVEHNLGLVMEVCEVLHVLNFGRVIASGPSATVVHDPDVVEAYTGLRR